MPPFPSCRPPDNLAHQRRQKQQNANRRLSTNSRQCPLGKFERKRNAAAQNPHGYRNTQMILFKYMSMLMVHMSSFKSGSSESRLPSYFAAKHWQIELEISSWKSKRITVEEIYILTHFSCNTWDFEGHWIHNPLSPKS